MFRHGERLVIASRQCAQLSLWPQHGRAVRLSAGASGPAALSDFCWLGQLLNKCAEAAGGRDKAPLYLHRLNSRINLPPLPLQPSPRFFPSLTLSFSLFPWAYHSPLFPPTFATTHLYRCHDGGNCFLTLSFFLLILVLLLGFLTGSRKKAC